MANIKLKNKRLPLNKAKSIKDKKDKEESFKNSEIILPKENDKKISYADIKSFRSDIFSENFDNSGSALTLINHCSDRNLNYKNEEIKSSLNEKNEDDSLITSKEKEKSYENIKNNNYLNLYNEKKLKSILKHKKTLANSQVENDTKKKKILDLILKIFRILIGQIMKYFIGKLMMKYILVRILILKYTKMKFQI